MSRLPEHLRDPYLLTICDKRHLIEFGRRRHSYRGGKNGKQRLRYEGGEESVEWFHVTGPQRGSMQTVLDNDANKTHTKLKLRMRLTSDGQNELAEWKRREPSTRTVPAAPSDTTSSVQGYVPADTLSHDHGIRRDQLSRAVRDAKVHTKPAPQGMKDTQGRTVWKLYHQGEAIKHCSPKHVTNKTRRKLGL